jgi:hypothetical protein
VPPNVDAVRSLIWLNLPRMWEVTVCYFDRLDRTLTLPPVSPLEPTLIDAFRCLRFCCRSLILLDRCVVLSLATIVASVQCLERSFQQYNRFLAAVDPFGRRCLGYLSISRLSCRSTLFDRLSSIRVLLYCPLSAPASVDGSVRPSVGRRRVGHGRLRPSIATP